MGLQVKAHPSCQIGMTPPVRRIIDNLVKILLRQLVFLHDFGYDLLHGFQVSFSDNEAVLPSVSKWVSFQSPHIKEFVKYGMAPFNAGNDIFVPYGEGRGAFTEQLFELALSPSHPTVRCSNNDVICRAAFDRIGR